jgi:hypothetical protein
LPSLRPIPPILRIDQPISMAHSDLVLPIVQAARLDPATAAIDFNRWDLAQR